MPLKYNSPWHWFCPLCPMTHISKRPFLPIYCTSCILQGAPLPVQPLRVALTKAHGFFIIVPSPTLCNRLPEEMWWALSLEIIRRPCKAILFPEVESTCISIHNQCKICFLNLLKTFKKSSRLATPEESRTYSGGFEALKMCTRPSHGYTV